MLLKILYYDLNKYKFKQVILKKSLLIKAL